MVKQLVRPDTEVPVTPQGPASDREYRMALARTRQAVHVQKAAVHARHRCGPHPRAFVALFLFEMRRSFCHAHGQLPCSHPLAWLRKLESKSFELVVPTNLARRDLARTVVELELALNENSICREPVIACNFTAEEMLELYRIAVENMSPKIPPNYGLLLQLQNMLDISPDKAQVVEKGALEQPGSFSI